MTFVLHRAGPELQWFRDTEPLGPAEPWTTRAAGTLGTPEPLPDLALPEAVRPPRGGPPPPVGVTEPALAPAVRAAGLAPTTLPLPLLRTVRERADRPSPPAERDYLLALARVRVQRLLASPEETLITLAREERRVERALGRERNARGALPLEGAPSLDEYRRRADVFGVALARHHGELESAVRRLSEELLPNLSALVGAKVAARLLAEAGGLGTLGRLSASRLQLLGTRRRPSGRGPRYGVIFGAIGMDEAPAHRKGAFARSLAALAVIAARADATTRRSVARELAARRERRLDRLRARAR